MPPTASIIVLTYNNLEYTRLCLNSIVAKTAGPDFELIVVDNASADGTQQFLQEFAAAHPNVLLRLNQVNEGFARGNNQGVDLSQGDYLVFLNNDIVVTDGWLMGLIDHLQDPNVGMVGPVTNISGNETRIRVGYDDLGGLDAFAAEIRREHIGQLRPVRVLPFLCVAIRREVYEEIGPLDERFGVGMFEDDDYALRVKQRGYRLVCAEDVFVHHWGSAGFSLSGFATYWQLYEENRIKFERKWGRSWQPHRYREELLDQQFAELWQEKRELALRSIELQEKLSSFEGSLSWRLFRLLRTAKDRVAPENSTRFQALNAIRRGTIGLIKTGLRAWRKLKDAWMTSRMRQAMGRQLDEILAAHGSVDRIVVFSPTVLWNLPLFQRPHQMALTMARRGCLVLFLEPPGNREAVQGIQRVEDNLYVVGQIPLDLLKKIPSPIVFTLAYNRDYLQHFANPQVVYEYIDELEVLPGDLANLQRDHQVLVQTAQVVVATADVLYERVAAVRPDALLSPNAVDYSFIQQVLASTETPPEDFAHLMDGRPVIGYYGALAKWFDYCLLEEVARLRPHYRFILIGLDYDGSFQRSDICRTENVHWLGPRPYTDLFRYLKYFNSAMIPFKLNPVTHSTSPLKLFEYFAAGKPVVTTAMRECLKYPGVFIGDGPDHFADRLDEALALQTDPSYLALLDETARANTWDQRAAQIVDALDKVPVRPWKE